MKVFKPGQFDKDREIDIEDIDFAEFSPIVDTAAKDDLAERRAKERQLRDEFQEIYGSRKGDKRRLCLGILLDDIRSAFAHLAQYFSAVSGYSSFSLLDDPNADPTAGKAVRIFRKADVFTREFAFSAFAARITKDNLAEEGRNRTMNFFCPGFSLGDSWEKQDSGLVAKFSGQKEHSVLLKDILFLFDKIKDDTTLRTAKEVAFSFTNRKYWQSRIRFKFETSVHVSNYSYASEGTIGDSLLSINIFPTVEIDYEAEAMAWCLSATDPKDITVYDVLRHIEPFERMVYKTKGKGANQCRERTAALGTTVNSVRSVNNLIGKSEPRISEDGFSILPDGRVLFLDYKPDINRFMEALSKSYNAESGEFHLDPSISNIPMIVDWSAGVMVWSNASLERINNTSMTDISEARALSDADIGNFLSGNLFGTVFFHQAHELSLRMLSDLPYWFRNKEEIRYNLPQLISKDNPVTVLHLKGDKVVYNRGGSEDQELTRKIVEMGKIFVRLFETYDTKENESVANRVSQRFAVYLFGKYAQGENSKRYIDADNKLVEGYTKKLSKEQIDRPAVIYNMPGLTHMMPHQADSVNEIDARDVSNVLVGARAGGGKTAIFTTAIANAIEKGRAKRPLVVMPKNLLRQYQKEVMHFYSKGNMRVFPIYLGNWKLWTRLGLTLANIEKIIESQPKNTIFVTDYNFLKYRPEIIALGLEGFASYPIARWAAKTFDMIVGDESHKVKNAKDGGSAVSRAYSAAVTENPRQILSSGTIIHNTSNDILGQVQKTDPSTFLGDISQFMDSSGKLLKSETMPYFHKQLRRRNSLFNISDKNWSFLLPRINETMHSVKMTPAQQAFYNEKLRELIGRLSESDEYIKAAQTDQENGNKEQQEFLLNRELSGFEIFLGAPDETQRSLAGKDPLGAEFSTRKNLTQKDLISPKVAKVDAIIDAHFKGGPVDGDESIVYTKSDAKIIIFAYNVAIPKHVYRHSRHKDIMIHYEADGEKGLEIIERFKNDPKIKVLVAGEKTLQEGHNLQVASRVIRLQPVWTPGEFDQSLRRVLRPDVPDENGNLKYNRDSIDMDWILVEPSFEIAKTCRLLLKFLDKTKFEEGADNPRFEALMQKNDGFKDLSLFSLNIESIIDYQTFSSLAEFQNMYAQLRAFEDREYDVVKRQIWARTILRLNKATEEEIKEINRLPEHERNAAFEKIMSSKELRMKAMLPVQHEKMTGVSEKDRADFTRGYTPLVSGVPVSDPYNLGLVPAATIVEKQVDENDDLEDDDSEDEVQYNAPVESGEIVVTEFGFGVAGNVRKARGGEGWSPNIPVEISGIGRVNLSAASVFVPQDDAQKERLKKIYNNLVRNRKPTSVLQIDSNSITLNDITVAAPGVEAPKPPTRAIDPKKAMDEIKTKINTVKPVDPPKAPNAMPGVRPMPGAKPAAPVITPSVKVQNVKPMPGSDKTPVKPAVAPVVTPKPPEKTGKLTPQQKKLLTQNFEISKINNQLCVSTSAEEGNDLFEKTVENHGFIRMGSSVMAQIINAQGLTRLVKYLDDNFYIPDAYLSELNMIAEAFAKSKESVKKIIPSLSKQREFLIRNSKRKVSDPRNEVHPIVIVIDGVLMLFMNNEIMKAPRKLLNKAPVKGVSRFFAQDTMYIKFYNSKNELIDDLDDLETKRGVEFKNLDDLAKDIKRL